MRAKKKRKEKKASLIERRCRYASERELAMVQMTFKESAKALEEVIGAFVGRGGGGRQAGQNFGGLVLGCIEAKFCNQILI